MQTTCQQICCDSNAIDAFEMISSVYDMNDIFMAQYKNVHIRYCAAIFLPPDFDSSKGWTKLLKIQAEIYF